MEERRLRTTRNALLTGPAPLSRTVGSWGRWRLSGLPLPGGEGRPDRTLVRAVGLPASERGWASEARQPSPEPGVSGRGPARGSRPIPEGRGPRAGEARATAPANEPRVRTATGGATRFRQGRQPWSCGPATDRDGPPRGRRRRPPAQSTERVRQGSKGGVPSPAPCYYTGRAGSLLSISLLQPREVAGLAKLLPLPQPRHVGKPNT